MKVWFKLVKEGKVEESATKVQLNTDADVDDFRDAVKVKCSNKLASVDAMDLQVYLNLKSLENKEQPIKPSFSVSNLGLTEESALFVVVPVANLNDTWLGVPLILDDENLRSGTYNGLDSMSNYLPRLPLLEKLYRMVKRNTFLLVASPQASGKTSLLQLFCNRYTEFKYKYISFAKKIMATNIL